MTARRFKILAQIGGDKTGHSESHRIPGIALYCAASNFLGLEGIVLGIGRPPLTNPQDVPSRSPRESGSEHRVLGERLIEKRLRQFEYVARGIVHIFLRPQEIAIFTQVFPISS